MVKTTQIPLAALALIAQLPSPPHMLKRVEAKRYRLEKAKRCPTCAKKKWDCRCGK